MPGHMENSLIFHYNLKFYGNDKDSYEGVSLKRRVSFTFTQHRLATGIMGVFKAASMWIYR